VPKSSPPKRTRFHKTRWGRAGIAVGAVGLALVLFVVALYLAPPSVAVRLGSPLLRLVSGAPSLPDEITPAAERSVVYDADGGELATLFADEDRVRVESDEIAQAAKDAVIATEDAQFYEHPGVNHRAVMRALVTNQRVGEVVQGGSTITQQYVKNALLSPEQTFRRKAHEAWMAIQLERRMSKDEILVAYLNEAYFGEGAYGIATAAERYFSRSAADLEPQQAAVLAAVLRAPSSTNPVSNPEAAQQRRDVVLGQMAQHGFLAPEEAEAAREQPIELALSPPQPPEFPFFTTWVTDQLLRDERLGEDEAERSRLVYAGGLEIHTTLDRPLQEAAEEAIGEVLADPTADPQATFTAVEPSTGAVRALAVGPRAFGSCEPVDGEVPADCDRTSVNPAVAGMGGSGRQPGSAFKPFVLAAAMEEGLPRGWQDTSDSGEEIGGCDGYEPRNYGDSDHGVVSMDDALRVSSNVYHVKVGVQAGPADVVDVARRLGLERGSLTEDCATSLGAGSVFPMELTSGYATIANGGERCAPYVVTRIARDGEDVVPETDTNCEQVLDADIADGLSALMEGVVTDGTGTRAQLDGATVAGKTGTTNDNHDAWFAGYTGGEDGLAAAVWMGYEASSPMTDVAGESTVTGGSLPADVWRLTMQAALEHREAGSLPEPPSHRTVSVPDFVDGDVDDFVNSDLEVVSAVSAAQAAADSDDGEPTGLRRHAVVGDYDLHLVVREVRSWEDPGFVIDQSVDPGTSVRAGTMLTVDVSDGQGEPPEIPDVVGMYEDDAIDLLEEHEYVGEVGADVEERVRIRPRDEEAWHEGEVDEPDEDARLSDVAEDYEILDDPDADNGEVVDQSPPAGDFLEPGEVVALTVARLVYVVEEPDPPEDDEDDEVELPIVGDDEDDDEEEEDDDEDEDEDEDGDNENENADGD
jgi:penicillin-binding protein 1A